MKYRKKPVVAEAEVYQEGMEDGWIVYYSDTFGNYFEKVNTEDEAIAFTKQLLLAEGLDDLIIERPAPYIKTLEGPQMISPGDYIITGVKGEKYPCKPDIFQMTYERCDEVESKNNQK